MDFSRAIAWVEAIAWSRVSAREQAGCVGGLAARVGGLAALAAPGNSSGPGADSAAGSRLRTRCGEGGTA